MASTLFVHTPSIECDGCAESIKRSLGKLAGVVSIEVDVAAKNVQVQYEESQVTEAAIRDRLTLAGFPPAQPGSPA